MSSDRGIQKSVLRREKKGGSGAIDWKLSKVGIRDNLDRWSR
jgi:hypothetical protein